MDSVALCLEPTFVTAITVFAGPPVADGAASAPGEGGRVW